MRITSAAGRETWALLRAVRPCLEGNHWIKLLEVVQLKLLGPTLDNH